jgi:hypothetical protein
VTEFRACARPEKRLTSCAARNRKFLARRVFSLFNCCTNGTGNANPGPKRTVPRLGALSRLANAGNGGLTTDLQPGRMQEAAEDAKRGLEGTGQRTEGGRGLETCAETLGRGDWEGRRQEAEDRSLTGCPLPGYRLPIFPSTSARPESPYAICMDTGETEVFCAGYSLLRFAPAILQTLVNQKRVVTYPLFLLPSLPTSAIISLLS